jgi:hypothetical protein
MKEEYLDKYNDSLKEGWYRHWDEKLYFVEKQNSKFRALRPDGTAFTIFQSDPICLLSRDLSPTTPDKDMQKAQEDMQNAQNIINFIKSKQSKLEQLTQVGKSDKSKSDIDKYVGPDDEPQMQ